MNMAKSKEIKTITYRVPGNLSFAYNNYICAYMKTSREINYLGAKINYSFLQDCNIIKREADWGLNYPAHLERTYTKYFYICFKRGKTIVTEFAERKKPIEQECLVEK